MGNFMKTFLLLISLLIFSKDTIAQIDSNLLFKESKGKWIYPIEDIYKFDCFENYKNRTEHFDHKTMFFFSKNSCQVKSVFAGEVVKVLLVDDIYFIITKCGDYFIGYFGIVNPIVKEKEFLKANQSLGYLAKGLDDDYSLEVTLNYNQEELDPSLWFS